MHWIEKFRKKMGVDRQQFADFVPCSEALIYLLENQNGGITHPKLANRIADICGATIKQRDSIVHKKHHGTWAPSDEPVTLGKNRHNVNNATAVVKIDENGNVLARYANMTFAAKCNNTNDIKIAMYCRRKQPKYRDEFEEFGGFTVRFAHEWDHMTKAERRRDIAPSPEVMKRRLGIEN